MVLTNIIEDECDSYFAEVIKLDIVIDIEFSIIQNF